MNKIFNDINKFINDKSIELTKFSNLGSLCVNKINDFIDTV